jgi:hypothetical protein
MTNFLLKGARVGLPLYHWILDFIKLLVDPRVTPLKSTESRHIFLLELIETAQNFTGRPEDDLFMMAWESSQTLPALIESEYSGSDIETKCGALPCK